MYFTSPTSSISSVVTMSSSTASSLAMDIRPRSSSSFTSVSGYSAFPYRSSVINATSSEEPSSYLSDEDLFFSADEEAVASPEAELTTEDHIAMLRKAAEQGDVTGSNFWSNQFQQPPQARRYSRLQPEEQKRKSPRPTMGKRKKSTSKKVVFATPSQTHG